MGEQVPVSFTSDAFYSAGRIKPVKLVCLSDLTIDGLLDLHDRLSQLYRDFSFYTITRVQRKPLLDDSFRLLRLAIKARRKGEISFEINL